MLFFLFFPILHFDDCVLGPRNYLKPLSGRGEKPLEDLAVWKSRRTPAFEKRNIKEGWLLAPFTSSVCSGSRLGNQGAPLSDDKAPFITF